MQGIGRGIYNGKYYKILSRQGKYNNIIKIIETTKKQYGRINVSFTDGQNELDNYFKKSPEEHLLDEIYSGTHRTIKRRK